MNPDSAHHDIADARVAELLNPHALAESAASSGYGITIRRNTGEDYPADERRLNSSMPLLTKAG